MMNFVRKVAAGVTAMFLSCLAWGGQRDTLLLTVDELFRMGMEMSLVLQADISDSRWCFCTDLKMRRGPRALTGRRTIR